MKKLFFALIAVGFVASCAPQHDGYTIKGTIAGVKEGNAILSNNSRTFPISDTVKIKNGKFRFTGKVITPEVYFLSVENKKFAKFGFFLLNENITITGDTLALDKAAITGSALVMTAKTIRDKRDSLTNEVAPALDTLLEEYENPVTTKARQQEIDDLYEAIEAKRDAAIREVYTAYVRENPHSPLSVALAKQLQSSYTGDELTALVAAWKEQPALQDNRLVTELEEYASIVKATEIGQPAIDFTQNNPAGSPLTFSDVYAKNKLTMIDFWASWCGPCRRFNPTLVKLYNKYHNKGFEIVAVSLDQDKAKWEKGIADDQLTWFHVSDLKFNAVAKQYNIRYIPQNVFVNAAGVIVAKRVSEKEMDEFLANQLK